MSLSSSGAGPRRHRPLAGPIGFASVLALLVGMTPPVAAQAATPTARSIESACAEGRTPRSDYRDVRGTAFEREIDCIHAYGLDALVVTGRDYLPGDFVTRAEMASFLANMLRAAGRDRPANLRNAFDDDDSSLHRANVDWLAHLGLVKGRTDGRFHPSDRVTRAAMATFISRTVTYLMGTAPSSSIDWFADDRGSVHEASINGLAAYGIVTGTGLDTYTPHGMSSRGQMAGFLCRTLAELVDRGIVTVPFGVKVITVTPTDTRSLQTSDNSTSTTRDRGQRAYSASIPAGIDRVTIALMPPSQIVRPVNQRPLFTANQVISPAAGVGIEIVDGTRRDQVDGSQDLTQVNDVLVGNDGVVTFTVDAVTTAQAAPVVWADTLEPSRNLLELPLETNASNPREALERVGVGGTTSWGLAEPARGQNLAVGTVRGIDLASGWYLLDTGGSSAADWLVRFAGNDDFTYTASNDPVAGSPGPITFRQFTDWLSVGDRVDPSGYDPGRMRHTLAGDIPLAPYAASATAGFDGTIRITFTKPSNPVADDPQSSFRLERAPTSGAGAGEFREIASRSGDKSAEFTDPVPTNGSWSYRVIARSVTGNSPASNVATATASAMFPISTSSRVSLDNGSTGSGSANRLLDRGDRLEFTFDRPVSVAGNWSITIQDRDGTRAVLDNTTATPTLATDGRTVTLTVASSGPRVVRSGADAGVDIRPGTSVRSTSGFLQVIDALGIASGSGPWNLTASGLPTAPGNESRTIIDGTGDARRTPAAPAGHLVLLGGTSLLELGRDEVQAVSRTNATGGTWRLGLSGTSEWTADLALNASASQVQTALEALSGIGVGAVNVSGGIDTAGLVVAFTGNLQGTDVARLRVDDAGLVRPDGSYVAPEVSTTVDGAAVTGVTRGDRVRVTTDQGVLLASVDAGTNGRTTISLPSAIARGNVVLVEVETLDNGRITTTALVRAS